MRIAVGYPMETRAEVEAGRKRARRVEAGTRLLFALVIILGTTWLTR